MTISDQDLAHITKLANIELSADEALAARQDLDGMLALIDRLQAVDTQGVEPLAHPLSVIEDITLRLREDEAAPTADEAARARLMANAPAQTGGLYLVPAVIE
jgi:aspartyl-tRNA(Asn)/glutamyl-tRNA(Gln) amidotransferase subunit C